ncbi:MAG TPA: homoserine kinase [Nocardioides sp.]|jgi:homoserine kinase|nr:homoserine kinase [Nocardioides sp.]
MTFVSGPVRVTVPATSANLGSGFDSLGLALELRDELEAVVIPDGLDIQVTGEAADEVATDEGHLVVRAMRAAFDAMGEQPPGLRLTCRNEIPHARGLGSSAAAIVGGIHLARALVEGGRSTLKDPAAFQLAARLEGHPDNVAAASFGGLTVAWTEDEVVHAAPTQVAPGIGAVAFVPPTPVSTEVARGLLPATVPHGDAAAAAGRTALLVAALGTGWTAKLHDATRDWLHQEYRRPAMPDSLALVDALRVEGHAAVVSGAGPTVLVLTDGAGVERVRGHAPAGWRCRSLEVATDGVRLG